MVLDDFSGGIYGIRWSSLNIQDAYAETNTDAKWQLVRGQFEKTNAGTPGTLYVNFLSASGTSGTPRGIAESLNPTTLAYLGNNDVRRTGVVMMDFPGAALIDDIIARNFQRGLMPGGQYGVGTALEMGIDAKHSATSRVRIGDST